MRVFAIVSDSDSFWIRRCICGEHAVSLIICIKVMTSYFKKLMILNELDLLIIFLQMLRMCIFL